MLRSRIAAGIAVFCSIPAAWCQGGKWFDAYQGPALDNPEVGAFGVASADFDGDGLQDLLFRTLAGGELHRGLASGLFALVEGAVPPVDASESGPVTIGDVDLDGDVDAIFSRSMASDVYLNAGNGQLGPQVTQSIATGSPLSSAAYVSALFDANGDGSLDFAQGVASVLRLHLGAGNGQFAPVGTVLPTNNAAISLLPVDIDLDLDIDLIAAGNMTHVLRNSAGSFSVAQTLPGGPAACGDIQGDGLPDLVLVKDSFSSHQVYANTAGTFALLQSLSQQSTLANPVDPQLVDLDGDNDLDLVIGGSSGPVRGYENMGGLFGNEAPVSGLLAGTRLEFLDVDGDADKDVILATVLGKSLALNDSQGAFHTLSAGTKVGLTSRRSVVDLDGDGDADILQVRSQSVTSGTVGVTVQQNDGSGGFAALPTSSHAGGIPAAMGVGDLDADGDRDVYVSTAAASTFAPARDFILRNDGSGLFPTEATVVDAPPGGASDVLLADIDGDALLDAVVASRAGTSSIHADRILRNVAGVLTHAPAALPVVTHSTSIGGADLDADGDLDLLMGQASGAPFTGPFDAIDRLFLNQGAGTYQDVSATHLAGVAEETSLALIADVDMDGDLDAYFVNSNSSTPGQPAPQRDILALNDGQAVMTKAPAALPALSYSPRQAVFADVDLDGDADLVRQTTDSGANPFAAGKLFDELYVNDGQGTFALAPTSPLPAGQTFSGLLVAADVDGDGDQDILDSQRVSRGLCREIEFALPLSIGAQTAIAMTSLGPPAAFLVLVGSQAAQIPVFPYGTLGIDPSGFFAFLATGVFDASGTATLAFPVPNLSSLDGVTVHFQALLDQPLRLSRVLHETILDV